MQGTFFGDGYISRIQTVPYMPQWVRVDECTVHMGNVVRTYMTGNKEYEIIGMSKDLFLIKSKYGQRRYVQRTDITLVKVFS